MSGELVAALNLDTCKGTLSADGQFYDWPCRLAISVPSTARITATSYVHAKPRLWRAAHQAHHDLSRLDVRHVITPGRRGSFTFKSKGDASAVLSVECSCEVKADA